MKFRPLGDRVLVKRTDEEQTSEGGIVLPGSAAEKPSQGEVISVGPGQTTLMGEFVKTISKVGDVVVLPTQGFTKLPYEGEEYLVGPENQILAKINK